MRIIALLNQKPCAFSFEDTMQKYQQFLALFKAKFTSFYLEKKEISEETTYW
jgi:hypothetical protein